MSALDSWIAASRAALGLPPRDAETAQTDHHSDLNGSAPDSTPEPTTARTTTNSESA